MNNVSNPLKLPTSDRPPHRRFRAAAVLALLAALVLWWGSRIQPADPNAPLELVGSVAPVADRETFRVGSFNIHGGKGTDGRLDLARTAAALEGLDLVGLYEVRADRKTSQAGRLARRLDAASLFAPTERRWWHDDFGNGLLARLPLKNWQRIPLPGTQDKKFRNAVLTSFEIQGQTVHLLATHVDTRTDRAAQLESVIALFLALEPPAILMGDLNSQRDDPLLQELLDRPDVTDALADANPAAKANRVDWIITRGLKTLHAEVRPNNASDHPLVWAEFTLPKAARLAERPSDEARR
jgi:endonuclease/exonuclease/phosphatase family metal-dependent hydrolase